MKRIALLSVLLLLVTVPVLADSLPNYSILKLGAYIPQADDLENFNSGFNVEAAVGQYLNPNVALELSIGYLKSNGNDSGVSGQVRAYPVLLSVKGVVPLRRAELYVLAGGGVYFADVRVSAFGVSVDETDTTSGFQAGVGGNFNVSENVFLGLEGRYFWSNPRFDSVNVHMDGILVTANVGYRF